jgi:hypothetical protein
MMVLISNFLIWEQFLYVFVILRRTGCSQCLVHVEYRTQVCETNMQSKNLRAQDSSLGVATELQTGDQGIGVQFLAGQGVFIFSIASRPVLGNEYCLQGGNSCVENLKSHFHAMLRLRAASCTSVTSCIHGVVLN